MCKHSAEIYYWERGFLIHLTFVSLVLFIFKQQTAPAASLRTVSGFCLNQISTSLLKKEQQQQKKSVLPPTDFCPGPQNKLVPACVTGADGGAEAGAAVGAWGGGVDFTSFSSGGICICCCCCCVKLFTNSSCWVFRFCICCWKATCTGCTTVAYSVIKFAW